MKRGGGRRYYRPQDVDLIKGIRHMLYDQGYTIKGVQRLLRENGVHLLVAIGHGDVAAIDAISQRRLPESAAEAPALPRKPAEEDALLGESKIKAEDDGPVAADASKLTRDNRALLQEALFDLLECKRLLDQVR
jgi:DNA-binding transcriptional MerR regulator